MTTQTKLVTHSSCRGHISRSTLQILEEKNTWHNFRLFGLLTSSFSVFLTFGVIFSKYWVVGKDFHLGLLESCIPPQQPLPPGNYSPPNSACHKIKPWLDEDNSSGHWQYAVIGLLIFSVAFGFLATMLAFCGICTAALPRKLYYYHSAGEIFFICALAVLAAVLIYPVAMESESKVTAHQYGHGYILTWVAVFIFLASSLCMCLDEIMRTITKACLSIQRRRGNSRV